ncbi:MAG TPA: tetratricopeptide repeat protein [Tepidisphaeraceae bacterium]|nr:tetratricopeptide repeat protein [Tepidisphaeraceae bacterium]
MNVAYQRALILHQQRRFADAERELKEVLSSDPHNAQAHAMLGLCLLERNEYQQANSEADQAVGLEPDLSFAHYVRARVLSDRNRLEEAGAAINEALRLDSFNPDSYALQASIRFAQRRWPDALASAEHGLSIQADHAGCANLRAMALVQLGRKAEAGAQIGASLARDPHNAVTHANQGWALLHQGQHKQALEHFREALRLDPEMDWARNGMVEALKAKYLIYRLMLRYFLWMSRLGKSLQWGLIIGMYVAFQLMTNAIQTHPEWAIVLVPLVIAYLIFAYLTWIASPLFNLLLRLNRFGRYALSAQQRVSSNWIGGALFLGIAALVAWPITHRFEALMASIYFLLMVLPLAGTFRSPAGWPRTIMVAYSLILALVGASAIASYHAVNGGHGSISTTNTLINAFLIGIFVEGWIANILMGMRVRR